MQILLMGINAAPETTGIAPYTSAMAARLVDAGHRIRMLTAFPHYPEWRFTGGRPPRHRRERLDGVVVDRFRHVLPTSTSGLSRLFSELSFGARLVLARWGTWDAVVLVSPALFATTLALVKARLFKPRTPVGIWVQDLYSLGMTETGSGDRLGLAARMVRAAERWTLCRADGLLVIHERFAEEIRKLCPSPAPIAVIQNWTHVTAVDADRAETRRRLAWDRDETIVLHTGNMGLKQDLGNVVEAAREADRRRSPVRFILMGDGGERAELVRSGYGIHRLEFAPGLPEGDYMAALQAADVLLVNEHEGLRATAVPSKLTSYFASGRPVVAATHAASTTAFEISAANAGVRVDPGRPSDLLAAVLRLRDDPDGAAVLGANGQTYRERVLSEDAAVASFDRWLGALASTRDSTSV